MFNVGDIVVIKKELEEKDYCFGFNSEMRKYFGKETKIVRKEFSDRKNTHIYRVNIDGGDWAWCKNSLCLASVDFTKTKLVELGTSLIRLRNGDRYIYLGETINNLEGFISLRDYGEDLKTLDECIDHDIIGVYTIDTNATIDKLLSCEIIKIVWEREKPKPMSLKEISRLLGHEVEIV